MFKENEFKLNRKEFLKVVGLMGIGSLVNVAGCKFGSEDSGTSSNSNRTASYRPVPRRVLGKTGVTVPCLSIGLISYTNEKKMILKKALQWGVNYWDTASSYMEGSSESGIGEFIDQNRPLRKDIFIVTKANASGSADILEYKLQASLQRLKTDYIDLFFGIHGMSSPDELTDEIEQWVKSAKQRQLIRYFGFSTHSNMADCLIAASKHNYIDALMTSYNFRLMQDLKLNDAIEACYKAGIGIIAMKTLGHSIRTDADRKMTDYFINNGFNEEQAKIKAVLEDKRISSACVGMGSMAVLAANVEAALDERTLSQIDIDALSRYARTTESCYCTGCSKICNAALPEAPYTSDIMRCLMYYNSYADPDMARKYFYHIPENVRSKLTKIDYRDVEAHCPQRIPIGEFVLDAVRKLA